MICRLLVQSVVHGTVGSFGGCHEEVLDLRHFLDNVQWNDSQHALSDPERVPSDLHELVPNDEVQKEQNHDVARKKNRVLVVSLVEVVED